MDTGNGGRREIRRDREARTAEAIAVRAIQRGIVRERAAKVRECADAWQAWNRRETLWREHFRPFAGDPT